MSETLGTQTTPDAGAAADARTLVRQALKAALATLDRGAPVRGADHPPGNPSGATPGHPYVSLVTVAAMPDGRPVLLLSGLALHTQNLQADARASLLFDAASLAGDPLAGGRVTLIGRMVAAAPAARERFLNRHPAARQYADFGDFAFYELAVERAHFIGGFGRIVRLTGAQMVNAVDDAAALVAAEADIIAHMNADHAAALNLYATHAGAPPAPGSNWRLVGCDPEGLDLLNGEHALRVAFDQRVTKPDACRHVLARMAATARAGRQV
jgi:heme iron utilization protein